MADPLDPLLKPGNPRAPEDETSGNTYKRKRVDVTEQQFDTAFQKFMEGNSTMDVEEQTTSRRRNSLPDGQRGEKTNKGTLAGKMKKVAEERSKFNFDIVALQEVRWKDAGKIKRKEFAIYYSGTPNKAGQKGTGFWVNKDMKNKILGFEPMIKKATPRCGVALENVSKMKHPYMPTEDSEEEETELFYHMLERTCESINKYDTLVLLEDFNAKIGKEDFVRTVTDMHSLHDETSSNGLRLCQLAESTALRIMSTSFPHKDIHKGTWRAPDGRTTNQIDHVLVNRRRRSSILDVRVCRHANCDSDHYLVKVKVRQKIFGSNKDKRKKRLKWDVGRLKVEKVVGDTFRKKINEESQSGEDIKRTWEAIREAITKAAKLAIGEKQRGRNEEWFDQECRNAIKAKNEARRAALQRNTRGARRAYKEERRIAKKLCRLKKKEAMNKKLKEINELHEKRNIRGMYEMTR
ncbi:craniofacial development protein 2-like [Temnothorax curvispinosus]|uniref:Craniofacial development protein 2-like n=1 Tax=Temnothorax curvispinosus TaxID=300111 RepID=A0A6J1QQI0_9HYME|nr:craniofacial development protein 2-like [Temnothorax curvispinosus]